MLRIAFIDHHLNNYHADKFLSLLRGHLSDENAEVVSAWESNPTGGDWCEKNGIPRAASIQDAVQLADGVMLLAPDNVEDHLALAATVLPFGKPTFIDKFLAPTVAGAQSIVELAKQHDARIFSASSLRYAVELEAKLPELQSQRIDELF